MIAAEQLQRYFVLLGQSPAGHKQHDAVKVVEVVSYDHFNSSRTAHGGVNLLKEGEWTLIACNARGDLQFHIVDVVAWKKTQELVPVDMKIISQ